MSGELGKVFVTVGAKLDEFHQSMREVDKSLKAANDKTKEWGQGFAETGKKLAIAGGAITAALGAMVYATVKAGEEINNLSTRYGIATETLSGYKLAADQNETSLQALAIGFKFLAKNIDEANKGNKEAKGAFDSLGVSLKDVHGKARPLNNILLDVADRFSKMENNERKAIIATQIFGRSGNELIPFLNQGRDGLAALTEKAQKMGMVFTQEGAAAADELGDAVTTLKDSMGGLGKTLVENIIPNLTGMVDGMTEGVSKVTQFFSKNKELATVLISVAGAIGLVATGMGTGLIAIGKILPIFKTLATTLGTSVAALGLAAIGIGLVAGAAFAAYKIYMDYADAVEYAAQAEERFNEVSAHLEAKLKKAADAAGMTRVEFQKLKEKYDGNIASLAMHIKQGDEGVKMQEALAKTGKEHAKALEKQAEKLGIVTPAMEAAKKAAEEYRAKLEKLKTELGLTFTSDLVSKIKDIELALKLYKGQLSPETEIRLKKELAALYDELATGGLITKAASGWFKELKSEVINISETIVNTALPAARKWSSAITDMLPESVNKEWKEASDKIVETWGSAIAEIIVSTADFQEKFKALMTGTVAALVEFMATAAGIPTPFAKALGAIVGALAGAKSGVDKWSEALSKSIGPLGQVGNSVSFLGKISDELIFKLAEMTGKFGKAGAEARLLGDMMRETGINVENFDIYLSKATNTLTLIEKGLLDTATGTALADDQFRELLSAAKILGKEGSVALVNFIVTAREMGLEIASVTEYVQGQLGKIPSALEVMVAKIPTLGDALSDLTKKLAEQESVLAKLQPGTQEYYNMEIAIRTTKQAIADTTAEFKANLDTITEVQNAGVLTVATFNSMVASGMSWGDALAAVGPTLVALKERYAELGLAADPALQELMNIAKFREENIKLFDTIDANLQVMKALANTGFLTAEALAAVESNAQNYYQDLIKAGASADDATRAMLPTLQAIYDAHVKSGDPIDENTQKLIDQAIKLGLIKPPKEDPGETMAKGFDKMAEALDRIAKLLEGAFGSAIKNATKKAKELEEAGDNIGDAWEEAAKRAREADWGKGAPPPEGGDGGTPPSFATGGIAWAPQLAMVAEKRPEIIMDYGDFLAGDFSRAPAIPGTGASTGAGANFPITLNIYAQTLDRNTIDRAAENLYAAIQRQAARRGA